MDESEASTIGTGASMSESEASTIGSGAPTNAPEASMIAARPNVEFAVIGAGSLTNVVETAGANIGV
jgi:hypothetical protein